MKKKIVVAVAAACMLFTAGCGNDEKVIQGDVQNVVTGEEQSEGTQEEGSGGQEEPKEAAAKGYVFIYNDVAVEIDADAAPVVEGLGESVSYFEAASCAFEGLDKVYTYNGFELDTYPAGEEDRISAVVIKDDSVSTAEGVSIGDSLAKVEETYGSDGVSEGGMIVYQKDGMKLCFILQDDAVVSIEYRTTVLQE